MRKATQPKYIKAERVRVGDTIRVSQKVEDCEIQRVGTVGSIRYEGSEKVYLSPHRVELLRWVPGFKSPYKIALLKVAYDYPQVLALFDMEKIND